MDKPYWKHCHYYIQHYEFDAQRIYRVFCGHCTHTRVRRKRPDAPACDNFTPSAPDEDHFVTKEYLSKALLEHLLSLEILPPIE